MGRLLRTAINKGLSAHNGGPVVLPHYFMTLMVVAGTSAREHRHLAVGAVLQHSQSGSLKARRKATNAAFS
jgi:hypothetical protein